VHEQSDGTGLISYNAHLLYTFINGKAPGDAKGMTGALTNWKTASPGVERDLPCRIGVA
jgi:hypothetical protein